MSRSSALRRGSAPDDAAQLLGVPSETLRDLLASGQLELVSIAGLEFVTGQSLQALLDAQAQARREMSSPL